MSSQEKPTRASRRSAINWMLDASRTMPFLYNGTLPENPIAYNPKVDLWARLLNKTQLPLVSALADVILPGDDDNLSASDLHIPDFIDEWISAPYPQQIEDRAVMLEGLRWMNKESRKRFKKGFTKLSRKHQLAICNDISDPITAKPIYESAVAFFLRFQKLTYAAFYTTDAGKEHLGNAPLPTFELPTKEDS